jgi:hypothetical protein
MAAPIGWMAVCVLKKKGLSGEDDGSEKKNGKNKRFSKKKVVANK